MADLFVIEERLMRGGREYLAALKKLGLDPDLLCWTRRDPVAGDGQAELMLVTSWADAVGPKPVYDLLFAAYDASATPKEIDPFIVSLHSPHTIWAVQLRRTLRDLDRRKAAGERIDNIMITLNGYEGTTRIDWLLQVKQTRSQVSDDLRRFEAFQRKVSALAA